MIQGAATKQGKVTTGERRGRVGVTANAMVDRRTSGSGLECPFMGTRHHARPGPVEPRRDGNDRSPVTRKGHDDAAGNAAGGDRGVPGDAAGPGQAGGPPAGGTCPHQPRLHQPGDRLGHSPRTARVLRVAGAAGPVADAPDPRRPRHSLGAVHGWQWRRAHRLHPGDGRGRSHHRAESGRRVVEPRACGR